MQPNHMSRRARALVVAAVLSLALPASVGAAPLPNPATPYIVLTGPGKVVPLINSGTSFRGVTFQGLPDGIGIMPVGNGSKWVDLYVNHEESHVPFAGFADFQDSSVSRVRINVATKQVVELEVALPASLGFVRFCSSFMAGPAEGFKRYTLFTNEESNDWLDVPAGAPYRADPATAPYRQAGYSVILDPASGAVTTMTTAGRLNHENQVFVPGGWKEFASLSGDDTFSAPGSQLYLHTAESERDVRAGKGQLWAFQVTSANGRAVNPRDPQNDANDYLEIHPGDTFGGRFIRVPNDIARGTTSTPPQDALESWSNANNVFQFVRIEDLAYDPDSPRTVYFADTGTTRLAEDPATGRLVRLASGGTNTNGRIFKMVLNARDPRRVDALSILVDADTIGMRNPDNIAVGRRSIMVQEDVSSAKIWRYDMRSTWTHVASVTHPVNPAAGESSGIIDMSRWLGAGWWALDVQSHVNLVTDPTVRTYRNPQTGQEQTYQQRLEDGQLLLMQLPGS